MVRALLTGTLLCFLSQAVVTVAEHKVHETAGYSSRSRRHILSSAPSSLGSTFSSFDSHSPVYEVVSTSHEDDDEAATQPAEEIEQDSDDADDDDCDLQQTDVDLCQYVRENSDCTGEEHYIPYLQTFYCLGRGSRLLLFLVYLLWMLLLFYALSEIAETFLVPAVEWIAETLKLPPAVAGVTLLSFAGGAPDLFTQLAAVSSGGKVDLDLAVASTLGSGLFISCVMTAAVVLIRTVDIVDTVAYVRDIMAYIAANLLVLLFVLDGELAAYEAFLLILLYAVYVAIACYTSKKAAAPEALGGVIQTSYGPNRAMQGLTRARLTGEQSPLNLACPSPGADGKTVRGTLARSWSWRNTGKLTQWLPYFLARVGLRGGPGRAVELPVWQTGSAARGVDDLETGEELLVIGGRNKDDVEEEHRLRTSGSAPLTAPPCKALHPFSPLPIPHPSPARGSTPSAAQHHQASTGIKGQQTDAEQGNGAGMGNEHSNPLRQKSTLAAEADDEQDDVIPALPHIHYTEGDEMALMKVTEVDGQVAFKLEDEGGVDITPIYAQEMGFTDQTLQQRLWQHAEATWHMYIHHGSSWPKQTLAVATSPLVLFMHLTNPSLHIESFSMLYGYCMAAAAPGFALLVLGLGPTALHWSGYFLLWAFCSGLVGGLIHWKLSMTGLGYASRMNASFATLSVVMSCVWLSLVASEVVALLQTFGMILNAPTDEIGGTILSWGETVPELVATFTLAKMGHSTMAIAGCFAGPVFNLMVGLGLPVLYQSSKQGPLKMEVTSGIKLLIIQGVLILTALVVVVPVVFHWRLHQQLGLGLLGVYMVFQLFFVLVEQGVLWA